MDDKSFPDCNAERLGLYPIVDSFAWIKKLLPAGIKTIQLRIKNKQGSELEQEIAASIICANKYEAKLFINDYWEIAMRHGAYGVHLGQEDLHSADLNQIFNAGLRLGISTHSDQELVRALAVKPSYIAFGPIYPTSSKIMPFVPQGIERLKLWRRTVDYPLVAIGGISVERLPEILKTNVDGIAMISAITKSQDPIAQTKHLLNIVNQYAINKL